METATTEGKALTMAEQVRAANDAARNTARTGEGGTTEGTEIVATAENTGVTPETNAQGEGTELATAAGAETEQETLIKIGDKTFKTEREALAYAEQAERERAITEAHSLGVREAIEALKPPVAAPVEEEDFETKFYSDPKTALKNLKAEATQEALSIIRAEAAREQGWTNFLNEFPDIDRQDAERILAENVKTIGALPIETGRKELARAVRAEYQRINEKFKPRTELPNKRGQAVSAGSATQSRGVTQQAPEKPLDFVSQMKKLKTHG